MSSEQADPAIDLITEFGNSIEERVRSELDSNLSDQFANLADIKNLAGDSTGHVHVYDAPRLDKAAFLSINVMPGGRYFNIHIIPESRYDIPRFLFEGMITIHGSQVSTDIIPDIDMPMNIVALRKQFAGVEDVFNEVKKGDINFGPSRQAHMRTFCSPYFLCTFGLGSDKLQTMEAIANRYLDEWLKLYNNAKELDSDAAKARQARRAHMANMVVELDPDRNMVVQVYGEETIQAIEDAVMI